MPEEGFINFGTDKKGDWARCVTCTALYYDWNPRENIARCPKCRKGGTNGKENERRATSNHE